MGQYTLGFAISAPIVALSMMQLRVLMVVRAGAGKSFASFLLARALTTGLALAILLSISLVVGGARGACIAAIGFAKCLDAMGDCFLGDFQSRSRLDVMGVSLMINGVLTLISIGSMMALSDSIVVSVWGTVFASFVASVLYPVWMRRGTPLRTSQGEAVLKSALAELRRASVLGISSGIGSLTANAPRYLLEATAGTAAQGLFSSISQAMLLLTTTVGSISQATLPWFVQTYEAHSDEGLAAALRKTLTVTALTGAVFVGMMSLLGSAAQRLLSHGSYGAIHELLLWLSAAAAVGAAVWFLDGALSTMGMLRAQLKLNSLTLIIVLLAGLVLVPNGGVIGAAQSVFVGAISQILMRVTALSRAWGARWLLGPYF